MSFMPNQAAKAAAAMKGTQMKPAFCSQICVVLPPSTAACGSPPNQPNTPAVIASGITNCTTLTPRLPSPALSASALPFCALGKKKLILAIEEAKLPPPKPHSRANARKMKYGVSGFCTASPIPKAGRISDQVVSVVHNRPPKIGTMNEYKMRSVAPERPGNAASQNSSSVVNLKP